MAVLITDYRSKLQYVNDVKSSRYRWPRHEKNYYTSPSGSLTHSYLGMWLNFNTSIIALIINQGTNIFLIAATVSKLFFMNVHTLMHVVPKWSHKHAQRIHSYTEAVSHAHTRMHTHKHIHSHADANTSAYAHTHTRIHPYTRTHAHTHTHTRTHARTYTKASHTPLIKRKRWLLNTG